MDSRPDMQAPTSWGSAAVVSDFCLAIVTIWPGLAHWPHLIWQDLADLSQMDYFTTVMAGITRKHHAADK
jgi:hypothetical protein